LLELEVSMHKAAKTVQNTLDMPRADSTAALRATLHGLKPSLSTQQDTS
jgi:hypothetical protein